MATLKTLSGKKEGNNQPPKNTPAEPLQNPSTRPLSMTKGKGAISKITGSGIKVQDQTGFYDDEAKKAPGAGQNAGQNTGQNNQQGNKNPSPKRAPQGPGPVPTPGPLGNSNYNMQRPPTSTSGPLVGPGPMPQPVNLPSNEQIPAMGGFINKSPMPRPLNPESPAMPNQAPQRTPIQPPSKPPKTAGNKAIPAGATSAKLPFKKK